MDDLLDRPLCKVLDEYSCKDCVEYGDCNMLPTDQDGEPVEEVDDIRIVNQS